jgi:hypothetical protein
MPDRITVTFDLPDGSSPETPFEHSVAFKILAEAFGETARVISIAKVEPSNGREHEVLGNVVETLREVKGPVVAALRDSLRRGDAPVASILLDNLENALNDFDAVLSELATRIQPRTNTRSEPEGS